MKPNLADIMLVIFLLPTVYLAVIGIWKLCLLWGWHAG